MNRALMDRPTPHNQEAEQSALSSMLLDAEMGRRLLDLLEPEDFHVDAHRTIFRAMRTLREQGVPGTDLVVVGDALRRSGKLDACGGMVYLLHMMDLMPTAANGVYYAGIVRENAIRRQVRLLGLAAWEAAYAENVFSETERLAGDLMRLRPLQATPERDPLDQLASIYDAACERKKSLDLRGFGSGWPRLDRLTGGFTPGFYILAGWTSIGKTAAACSIVQHVCRTHRVLFHSLEMSVGKLHTRMLAQMSGVTAETIRQGVLADDERPRFEAAYMSLQDAILAGRLDVRFTADLTVGGLAQSVREARRAGGVDLVVVDYASLLRVPGIRPDQTRERNQEIADAIKAISGREEVAILLLNQLKRPDKERSGKAPRMEDLAESASYERHMDVGLFLYREDYQSDGDLDPGEDQDVQLVLRKNRDGAAGSTIHLKFRPETTLFYDPSAASQGR